MPKVALEHVLVPKHEIVPQDQVQELLAKHGLKLKKLPRLLSDDPAVMAIDAQRGDLLKITRKSQTAGESIYFRVVV